MVDYLVARAGFARLVAYFSAFAESQDHAVNFERSFGLAQQAFEREVRDDLATRS